MRLTCKTANGYCDTQIATRENKLTKLGELEDIEEELGIDLITFIKVVEAISKEEYIWTKYNCESYFPDIEETNDVVLGDNNGLMFIYFYWDNGKHLVLKIKDYSKTWALTKEELL